MNSTHYLIAFGLVFLFFVMFGGHIYRIYSLGLQIYYDLRFRRGFVAGNLTGWNDFIKYIYWLWFFTITTGVGSTVLAALYVKKFLLP